MRHGQPLFCNQPFSVLFLLQNNTWVKSMRYCQIQHDFRCSEDLCKLDGKNISIFVYFDPSSGARDCYWACLPVPSHISKTTCPDFAKFCVHVMCSRRSSFFDGKAIRTLCTYGFMDDVMFSHNGANEPESKATRMFHRVCQVAAPGNVWLYLVELMLTVL